MIITDLDDTLLKNEKSISDYTLSVLKKCREQNIITAFATARSKPAAAAFLKIFDPDVFIGYDGALAVFGDKIIYRSALSAAVSNQLIGELLSEPRIGSIYAINENVRHTNNKNLFRDGSVRHYELHDFTVDDDFDYLKITAISDCPEVVNRIAEKYPCDLLRYVGENMYKFANREALKQFAVAECARHFGIELSNVAAFGDSVNDVGMLGVCGYAVAVENAIPEAKAAAKFICGSNESDGVAKWIDQNIFVD